MNSYGRQKSIQLKRAVNLIVRTNTKEAVQPPVWANLSNTDEHSSTAENQRSRSRILENLPPKKMLVKGLGFTYIKQEMNSSNFVPEILEANLHKKSFYHGMGKSSGTRQDVGQSRSVDNEEDIL